MSSLIRIPLVVVLAFVMWGLLNRFVPMMVTGTDDASTLVRQLVPMAAGIGVIIGGFARILKSRQKVE